MKATSRIAGPKVKNLARRDFIKIVSLVSSAAGLSAFLDACQRFQFPPDKSPAAATTAPPPTLSVTEENYASAPSQTPAEINPMEPPTQNPSPKIAEPSAKIALVKTGNRAAGIRQAMEMLGLFPIAEQHVFLKPNYNSSDPAPGSTHPETLHALIQKLQAMGAASITVGDRSGMGNTRRVFEKLGIFEQAVELGFSTIILDELAADDWVSFNVPGSHWRQGFPVPRFVLESKAVVQTCCLKTHRYGGHFTLSLKNSVGLVAKKVPGDNYDYMNELHDSPDQRLMIAEINAAYQPAVVLLDAVDGFVTGGPDQGKLVHPGLILAGMDRIAIDAVGVAILRTFGTTSEVSRGPIFKLEQIARAVELGLGITNASQIELLTSDKQSKTASAIILETLNQS